MKIFYIVSIILIFLIDGVPLIKKKQWRELATFSFLAAAAVALIVLNILQLPNPINWASSILEPIGRMVFKQY